MMSDVKILQEMIKTEVIVPLIDKDGKKFVVLCESCYPDSSVTITGIPENAIVIKADAFKSPDTIFNCLNGECKRADFVIVADAGRKKSIVFIEIKAGSTSEKEVVQQLSGARCFITYCQEIGKTFWKQPDFLSDYSFRFIGISRASICKRKTRIIPQADIHDTPERMLKISSPHRLQFNHLAGKV